MGHRVHFIAQEFKAADADGNGAIDKSEVSKVFAAIGEQATDEQVEKMVAEIDLDSDGRVSFPEFLKVGFILLFGILLGHAHLLLTPDDRQPPRNPWRCYQEERRTSGDQGCYWQAFLRCGREGLSIRASTG